MVLVRCLEIEIVIIGFGRIPEDSEAVVGDDVATRVGMQPIRATVMIGMTVGDHNRVNAFQRDADQWSNGKPLHHHQHVGG